MALTNEEKGALKELKAQGYSFDEAMGFLASARMGNTSRVEMELNREEEPASDAASDLSAGWQGAKAALNAGVDRRAAMDQEGRGFLSRQYGKFTNGLGTAGSMLGSLGEGVVRALPGGTTLADTAGKVASSQPVQSAVQGVDSLVSALPDGIERTVRDTGRGVLGAAEIGGALVAPGASKALTTGMREFRRVGIRSVGDAGITEAVTKGMRPEDIMQRVARLPKSKQAKFEEIADQSVGEYLVERGIFGDPERIVDQLYARMKESKARAEAGLAQVNGTFKNGSVTDALNELSEREARVSAPNTPSRNTARVADLKAKHDREGLTATEINEVKRLYESTVKLDYMNDRVSDKIAHANNVDSAMREYLFKLADDGGFEDLKALNKETRLAYTLLDDLGAEYAGQAGNNYMGLSDTLFLVEATGNPAALVAFGLKKTFGSKYVMSNVAKLLANKQTKKPLPTVNVQPRLPQGQEQLSLPPATPR